MSNLDLDLVRHALEVARRHGFAEVGLELGEDHFQAVLDGIPKAKRAETPEPIMDQEAELAPSAIDVRAPLVGYFRWGNTPLEVGMKVETGDHLAVIAALGIANDVDAPTSGVIVEVLAGPNQPVEFGQVLARIEP